MSKAPSSSQGNEKQDENSSPTITTIKNVTTEKCVKKSVTTICKETQTPPELEEIIQPNSMICCPNKADALSDNDTTDNVFKTIRTIKRRRIIRKTIYIYPTEGELADSPEIDENKTEETFQSFEESSLPQDITENEDACSCESDTSKNNVPQSVPTEKHPADIIIVGDQTAQVDRQRDHSDSDPLKHESISPDNRVLDTEANKGTILKRVSVSDDTNQMQQSIHQGEQDIKIKAMPLRKNRYSTDIISSSESSHRRPPSSELSSTETSSDEATKERKQPKKISIDLKNNEENLSAGNILEDDSNRKKDSRLLQDVDTVDISSNKESTNHPQYVTVGTQTEEILKEDSSGSGSNKILSEVNSCKEEASSERLSKDISETSTKHPQHIDVGTQTEEILKENSSESGSNKILSGVNSCKEEASSGRLSKDISETSTKHPQYINVGTQTEEILKEDSSGSGSNKILSEVNSCKEEASSGRLSKDISETSTKHPQHINVGTQTEEILDGDSNGSESNKILLEVNSSSERLRKDISETSSKHPQHINVGTQTEEILDGDSSESGSHRILIKVNSFKDKAYSGRNERTKQLRDKNISTQTDHILIEYSSKRRTPNKISIDIKNNEENLFEKQMSEDDVNRKRSSKHLQHMSAGSQTEEIFEEDARRRRSSKEMSQIDSDNPFSEGETTKKLLNNESDKRWSRTKDSLEDDRKESFRKHSLSESYLNERRSSKTPFSGILDNRQSFTKKSLEGYRIEMAPHRRLPYDRPDLQESSMEEFMEVEPSNKSASIRLSHTDSDKRNSNIQKGSNNSRTFKIPSYDKIDSWASSAEEFSESYPHETRSSKRFSLDNSGTRRESSEIKFSEVDAQNNQQSLQKQLPESDLNKRRSFKSGSDKQKSSEYDQRVSSSEKISYTDRNKRQSSNIQPEEIDLNVRRGSERITSNENNKKRKSLIEQDGIETSLHDESDNRKSFSKRKSENYSNQTRESKRFSSDDSNKGRYSLKKEMENHIGKNLFPEDGLTERHDSRRQSSFSSSKKKLSEDESSVANLTEQDIPERPKERIRPDRLSYDSASNRTSLVSDIPESVKSQRRSFDRSSHDDSDNRKSFSEQKSKNYSNQTRESKRFSSDDSNKERYSLNKEMKNHIGKNLFPEDVLTEGHDSRRHSSFSSSKKKLSEGESSVPNLTEQDIPERPKERNRPDRLSYDSSSNRTSLVSDIPESVKSQRRSFERSSHDDSDNRTSFSEQKSENYSNQTRQSKRLSSNDANKERHIIKEEMENHIGKNLSPEDGLTERRDSRRHSSFSSSKRKSSEDESSVANLTEQDIPERIKERNRPDRLSYDSSSNRTSLVSDIPESVKSQRRSFERSSHHDSDNRTSFSEQRQSQNSQEGRLSLNNNINKRKSLDEDLGDKIVAERGHRESIGFNNRKSIKEEEIHTNENNDSSIIVKEEHSEVAPHKKRKKYSVDNFNRKSDAEDQSSEDESKRSSLLDSYTKRMSINEELSDTLSNKRKKYSVDNSNKNNYRSEQSSDDDSANKTENFASDGNNKRKSLKEQIETDTAERNFSKRQSSYDSQTKRISIDEQQSADLSKRRKKYSVDNFNKKNLSGDESSENDSLTKKKEYNKMDNNGTRKSLEEQPEIDVPQNSFLRKLSSLVSHGKRTSTDKSSDSLPKQRRKYSVESSNKINLSEEHYSENDNNNRRQSLKEKIQIDAGKRKSSVIENVSEDMSDQKKEGKENTVKHINSNRKSLRETDTNLVKNTSSKRPSSYDSNEKRKSVKKDHIEDVPGDKKDVRDNSAVDKPIKRASLKEKSETDTDEKKSRKSVKRETSKDR